MTYLEALRHAVHTIIDADLTATETRTATLSLIPKEFHVAHRQP